MYCVFGQVRREFVLEDVDAKKDEFIETAI